MPVRLPPRPVDAGPLARVLYHDSQHRHPICDDKTGGHSVKLDLLYEIDAPRPWDAGEHPWGQRAREQRAYGEMLDQVKLADTLGFNIAWFVEHHFREGRSHCPAPEVVIGALTQATENLRLGFGVTLLPYGFTHPARGAE